jgi:hypothetical protein
VYKCNVGVPTGKADNVLVVDIDVKEDGKPNPWLSDQPEKLNDLAVAPLSLTPRGGRHFFFRKPAGLKIGSRNGIIAPGVDIKADGGYHGHADCLLVAKLSVRGKVCDLTLKLLNAERGALALAVRGLTLPRQDRSTRLGSVGGGLRADWSPWLAAQVGWAAAVLSIAIGLGSGLIVARLGLLDLSDSASGAVEPFLIGDPSAIYAKGKFFVYYIFGTDWVVSGDNLPEREYKIGVAEFNPKSSEIHSRVGAQIIANRSNRLGRCGGDHPAVFGETAVNQL